MKLIPYNPLGDYPVPTLTKISSPEAALVRYYDKRIRKAGMQTEIWRTITIVLVTALITFGLLEYAFGATQDTARGREIMMPYTSAYTPEFVKHPTDFSQFELDYSVKTHTNCQTDTECANCDLMRDIVDEWTYPNYLDDVQGYHWDEVVND